MTEQHHLTSNQAATIESARSSVLLPEKVAEAARVLRAIQDEMRVAVVGQDDIIAQVLLGLVAGGHVLIEGVPGLGKTLLVKALAKAFDGEFSRIQFTPDLMPSDITGHTLFDARSGEFRTRQGPVSLYGAGDTKPD